MSSIATDQGSLHYEVFGKGTPVILLHGYQGSWGLWQATMEALSTDFRTYALDFWGFGESGARRSGYAVDDFAGLILQFMLQLGIARAPLVGHSMGGTVGLLFAAQHPDRVQRIVAVDAPIIGGSLRFFPRVFGNRAVAWMTYHNLWLYRWIYRRLAPRYCSDPAWPNMMDRDVTRTTLEAFFESVGSLRRVDLRMLLQALDLPVLGIFGRRDNIVDPSQADLLQRLAPDARIAWLQRSGHFPMLDEPQEFVQQVCRFLHGN